MLVELPGVQAADWEDREFFLVTLDKSADPAEVKASLVARLEELGAGNEESDGTFWRTT